MNAKDYLDDTTLLGKWRLYRQSLFPYSIDELVKNIPMEVLDELDKLSNMIESDLDQLLSDSNDEEAYNSLMKKTPEFIAASRKIVDPVMEKLAQKLPLDTP